MRKIIDKSTNRGESWSEVDVCRSKSGARRGEKSEEERMEYEYAKVEGEVGGVLISTTSMPGVHFMTVSPGGCTVRGKNAK